MNPQQMMDMRLQNIRTAMGTVPDDQWAVLSGKIQKVLTLEGYYNTGRNQMPGFGRGGMGGRGGRGGRFGGAGAAPDPANTVEGPVTDLDTLLQNQAASPDELKAKLTALRDARKKVLADLTAAQDDLQKVCDVHQEAVLVSLSILD